MRKTLLLSVGVVAAVLIVPASAATRDCIDNTAITWRVAGGFSVFVPEAAERGDELLDAVAAVGGRMQPGSPSTASAYDSIVRLLVDDEAGEASRRGTPPLYKLTYWSAGEERYVLDDAVIAPKTYDITASFAATGDCVWTVGGVDQRLPCGRARLTVARNPTTIIVRSSAGAIATTCAQVEDRLIVGMGDSYASGEGNPDRPTRWRDIPAVRDARRVPPLPPSTQNDRRSLWDRDKNGPLRSAPSSADAAWWDNSCHRSLLSQQALGAIAYAAADRHRRVLFLSYACSGATIFDGIAGPRLETPGALRFGRLLETSVALRESQITQLLHTLCVGAPLTPEAAIELSSGAPTWQYLRINGGPKPDAPRKLDAFSCPKPFRKPDAILLSIGGNDIGFGGVGAWALMPERDRAGFPVKIIPAINRSLGTGAVKRGFGLVCPYQTKKGRCRPPIVVASELAKELPTLFDIMDQTLTKAGLGATRVKLQMRYPPITTDQDGKVSGCLELLDRWPAPGDEQNAFLDEAWMPQYNLVLAKGVLDFRGRWSFGIRASEMRTINDDVLTPLNQRITENAGWTILGAGGLPKEHGLCATSAALAALDPNKPADLRAARRLALGEFGWPRFDGGWVGDRPSPLDWQPYAPRARWFRTATDSALTQTVFDRGTRKPAGVKRRDASLRLDEATSGTIHPSLPMHAAMGELIAKALTDAFEGRPVAPGPREQQ